jgi:hypothetical protein
MHVKSQTLPIIFHTSNIFFHVYNPFYYNPFNHSEMIILLFYKTSLQQTNWGWIQNLLVLVQKLLQCYGLTKTVDSTWQLWWLEFSSKRNGHNGWTSKVLEDIMERGQGHQGTVKARLYEETRPRDSNTSTCIKCNYCNNSKRDAFIVQFNKTWYLLHSKMLSQRG